MTELSARELDNLDAQLLLALESGQTAQQISVYQRVASHHLAAGDVDAACFYATQAWVLALASGDAAEASLQRMLRTHGRVP